MKLRRSLYARRKSSEESNAFIAEAVPQKVFLSAVRNTQKTKHEGSISVRTGGEGEGI